MKKQIAMFLTTAMMWNHAALAMMSDGEDDKEPPRQSSLSKCLDTEKEKEDFEAALDQAVRVCIDPKSKKISFDYPDVDASNKPLIKKLQDAVKKLETDMLVALKDETKCKDHLEQLLKYAKEEDQQPDEMAGSGRAGSVFSAIGKGAAVAGAGWFIPAAQFFGGPLVWGACALAVAYKEGRGDQHKDDHTVYNE